MSLKDIGLVLLLGASLADSFPKHFVKGGAASRDASVSVLFVVKHKNLDQLEQTALRVSDPFSKSYGKYLSRKQVDEMVDNKEARTLLSEWLLASGYLLDSPKLGPNNDNRDDHYDNGMYIRTHATVDR